MNSQIEQLLAQVQKPGRYAGGELNSVVKPLDEVEIRYAFCFPDLYEVGMSHLGMKILYSLLNNMDGVWCERVFAPDTDMEQLMRERHIDLFGLESRDSIRNFDFIGFTLQYEMSYTGVLNMLELAGVPLLAKDRDDSCPIVVAGGPCACNPEPLADFVDVFSLGEGEEATVELTELYRKHKRKGFCKADFLREAAQIEGHYVPSLYDVTYNEDGTVHAVTPKDGAPAKVRKRIMLDMDKSFYPDKFVVPFTEIVHDRAVSEIFRGCIRGCRFCQAGYIYRPVREKSPDVINRQSHDLCASSGYEEFSLSSLSTSDYTKLEELLPSLLEWAEKEHTNISLPSLRVDGFSEELANRLNVLRRSGLTFAPEAGTQRLRDAINKNLSEDEILRTATKAFAGGWTAVKLYFMMGLPTETLDDIAGIAELGQKIVNLYYQNPNRPRGKGVNVSISASCFVPKPFTPFQWEPQDRKETLIEKQKLLKSALKGIRGVEFSYHEPDISVLEAVFARGDRKLADVLERAWELGARFDSWDEHFKLDAWNAAFEQTGVDPDAYAHRRREKDEALPWDHIDSVVTKEYIVRESERAYRAEVTKDCRLGCNGCFGEKYATYCKIN